MSHTAFSETNKQKDPIDENESNFRFRASTLIESNWSKADLETELFIGKSLASQILSKYPLLDNPKAQEYINLIGQGIAAMYGRSDINYYFAVIDANHINAYATPGGYIFITSGLLKNCKNEAQLAGVIAHEISHINRKYILEKFNLKGKDNSVISKIGTILEGSAQTTKTSLSLIINQIFESILYEGLDKDEELKADQEAILMLSGLNYNLKSYVSLLSSINADLQEASVSHTHPSAENRIVVLNETIALNNLKGKRKKTKRFNSYVQ